MQNAKSFLEAAIETLSPYGALDLQMREGVARVSQEHQRPLDHVGQIRLVVWQQKWGSVVQVTVHHALMDGFSIVLLMRKFKLLLQGKSSPPYPQIRREAQPAGVFKQPAKQHLMLLKLTEGRRWRPVVADLFQVWLQQHFPRTCWAHGKLAHGRGRDELRNIGVFCRIDLPEGAPWVRSILNELPEFDFAVPGSKRILLPWINPVAEVELQSTLRGDLLYLTFRVDTELCSRPDFEHKVLAFRDLMEAQLQPAETPVALPATQVSLRAALQHHAQHHPDVLALQAKDWQLTYLQLWDQLQAPPVAAVPSAYLPVDSVTEALRALLHGQGYNFGPAQVEPHADPCCVVYSSGTTGAQKPIRLCLSAVERYLGALQGQVHIRVGERVMQAHAWTFDGHLENLGLALLNGATLVLPPAGETFAPQHWQDIQHASVPTAVFHLWASTSTFPASLKTVVVGGEPLQPSALQKKPQKVHLINTYGPAEATISVTLSEDHSLGVPLDPEHLQLVDETGNPVPEGNIGEIQLSGSALSPDVAAPYRTGDLAFFQQGKLWFVGRKQGWVKVRGHRIHLQEVASEISGLRGVDFAHVVLRKERVQVLYHPATATEQVWKHTQHWRIPLSLMPLHHLPLTPHGKVDLQALENPDWAVPAGRTPQEAAVLQLAAEVLDRPVALQDDLFQLGMDSLDVVHLTAGLGRLLGRPVAGELVYRHRTLQGVLENLMDPIAETPAVAAQLPAGPATSTQIPVIGANGFVGIHLLDQLQKAGLQPLAVVRADTVHEGRAKLQKAAAKQKLLLDWEGLEVQTLQQFLHNQEIYGQLINAAGCTTLTAADSILHAANVQLVQQLTRKSLHLHQCSSLSVLSWDFQGPVPAAEEVPAPTDPYSRSKWQAEQWLTEQNVPHTLYRITRCWGSTQGSEIPKQDLALQMLARHPGWLEHLDALPVDVVAKALVRHLQHPEQSILHLRSPWSTGGKSHEDAFPLQGYCQEQHQQHLERALKQGQAGCV